MGMYYYIETKEESDDDFEFPDGLSYFFEQLGGYGETSMVSQVERILDVDLSLFQKTYHHDEEFDDEDDEESYWLSIASVETVIDDLTIRISTTPDYFQQVKYDGILYPQDTGYLSSGDIVKDLKALKSTLEKLKARDHTEIRLVYA